MTKATRFPFLLSLLSLCILLLLSINAMQSAFASGETIISNASATTELKIATTISDISINGVGDDNISVKLLVTSGMLSMTTTTNLTFKDANGNVVSNPQTGSTLYFSGLRSDVNAALATLQYTRNTTGTDTLEISLVNPGEVFFSGNDHLYEYVSSTLDWNAAKTAAEWRTKYGATGYLATITSQEENDFVSARLLNAGWMGAGDMATEGTWKWVTGPENGTTFCIGNISCVPQGGQYTNWNTNEPNDSGGNEDCGQFLAGGSGKWNDLPCSGTTLPGYVVEYGSSGNMPSVAAANIDITTSDTTAPTTPGTPSATTPTTDNTPTVSWTAASDAGVGLKNPAYTLEWSASPTFSSVSGSSTTNSTSLAPSTLADGTWYFRVIASDSSDNTATSGISGGIIIDTTPPTTPSMPSAGVEWTNDNTPTWNWTPSVDSGVGLAYIAYAVEWSQDTSFFGLGGTAGILEADSYTIPDGLNMSDGTWYFHIKGIDALGNESPWSDYGTVHIDTMLPVISTVAAGAGSSASKEVITWTTDKNSSSKVTYGPTSSLGTSTTETDISTRVQNHSVTLTNLVPCSIYHFTVTSQDIAGNLTTSSDNSFITKGCAGSADVVLHTDMPITTTGGSLNLGSIGVRVPSGFASTGADFQIKQINRTHAINAIGSPFGVILAGTTVYDIKALKNGTTALTSFNKPITIILHYDDSDVALLDETSLAIYRWDEGVGWTQLSDCNVDNTAKTVTCTTRHFSTFALFGAQKIANYTVDTSGNAADSSDDEPTGTDQNQTKTTDVGVPNTSSDTSDKNTTSSQKKAAAQTAGLQDIVWWCVGAAIVLWVTWLLIWRRRRKKQDEAK